MILLYICSIMYIVLNYKCYQVWSGIDMYKIVVFFFLTLFSIVGTSYSNDYEDAIKTIVENAGTGDENGSTVNNAAVLNARNKLVSLSNLSDKNATYTVKLIGSYLNPTWKYTPRGSAYRIVLLQILRDIGKKSPKTSSKILNEVLNDKEEKNRYVKMHAMAALNTIQGNEYNAPDYSKVFKEINEEYEALLSKITQEKYIELKEEKGIEELVKMTEEITQDSKIKLALLMSKDSEIQAVYQGGKMLFDSGHKDKALKVFADFFTLYEEKQMLAIKAAEESSEGEEDVKVDKDAKSLEEEMLLIMDDYAKIVNDEISKRVQNIQFKNYIRDLPRFNAEKVEMYYKRYIGDGAKIGVEKKRARLMDLLIKHKNDG